MAFRPFLAPFTKTSLGPPPIPVGPNFDNFTDLADIDAVKESENIFEGNPENSIVSSL